MSSSFTLNGRVILDGGSAIKAAEAVANRLERVSKNGRTTSAVLKETAAAAEISSRAMKNEAAALSTLATAQEKANATRRASLANMRLTNAKTAGVTQTTADKTALLEGQKQLALNRALTETERQKAIASDASGRAAMRASQIKSRALRDQIAQEKLALAQTTALQRNALAAQRATTTSVTRLRTGLEGVSSTALRVSATTGLLFVGLAANAILMERQFANVVRTSDILDGAFDKTKYKDKAAAINGLRLQFDALAQTLPVSYKELTEIGSAANQLGVTASNLAPFTRTVAQFSATTGVSVDTTATALGRLDSLIPDVKHNYQELADAINKVGVNSVATDQQIINVASQIAGVASSAGLGYKSVIGFSGALASVAVSPYLARGLSTRLFSNLNKAVSEGGGALTKFAVVSGMTSEQFKKDWNGTDEQKQTALVSLFEGIHKAGPNAVKTLKDLGIISVLDQAALIKLANAADTTGEAGKLLTQTFRDANNASGENAKQYAKIAETVDSKLKVALNRVQILFRNIGNSNLGPLGAAIDGISSSVLKLSQGLDKPFKLLGAIELPFTNGEMLGFASLAIGAIAGFTLLVGVLSKVVTSFIKVGEGVSAVRGFLGRGRTAAAEYAGAVSAASKANLELAASSRAVASAQKVGTPFATALGSGQQTARANSAYNNAKPVTAATSAFGPGNRAVNYQTGLSSAVGNINAQNSMFTAQTGRIASLTNAISLGADRAMFKLNNLASSGNGVVRALAPLGTTAVRGINALGAAAKGVGGAISTLGKGIVGMLGPIGIAMVIGSAVLALVQLRSSLLDAGTSADQAAYGLTRASTAAQALASVQVDQNGGGLISVFTGPKLGSFVKGTKEFASGLDAIGKGGGFNDWLNSMKQNLSGPGGIITNFDTFSAGLKKLDDGFKQLSDGGHPEAAIQSIQTLFKGMTDDEISNALDRMSNAQSILTTGLNEAGIAAGKDNANVIALAHSNAILATGTKAAAAAAANAASTLQANAADTVAYVNATKNAAAAAGDLNKIWGQVPTTSKNPYADFIKATKASFQDFVDAQKNAVKIAADTGANLADIAALDPHILSGAVKSGRAGEKQLAEALTLKDAIGNYQAAIAQLGSTPELLKAFGSVGPKAQQAIADSLSKGNSIEEAFKAAGVKGAAAYNKAVADAPAPKVKAPNTSELKGMKAVIDVTANPANAITKGETAATFISNLKAQFTIEANNLPAVRTGENASDYIKRIPTVMQLLGDSAPVIGKGETAASYVSRLRPLMKILGDSLPAAKAGESAKHYIDRIRSTFKIDADAAAAKKKADDAKRYADGKVATIKITAATAAFDRAIAYAARTRTATIVAKYTSSGSPSGPTPGHGGVQINANGGPIRGAGTGTSDSILSWLSNGEYVIRASQAQKYRSLLDLINNGVGGYATGGLVTGGSANYNDTMVAMTAPGLRRQQQTADSSGQIMELSPYDRHLLQTIANNIGVTIAPDYIAGANTNVNRAQSRRGNG